MWKCEKVTETDWRPHGGEGFSFQYFCRTDSETGTAYAIVNPTNCDFAYLSTMPTKRGIGTAVLPLVEDELEKRGCKTIYAIPETHISERLLKTHGYTQSERSPIELKRKLTV